MADGQCPAMGKACYFCRKQNHFKSQCSEFTKWKKKKELDFKEQPVSGIHFISDDVTYDENFDDFVFRVSDLKSRGKVEGASVPFCN